MKRFTEITDKDAIEVAWTALDARLEYQFPEEPAENRQAYISRKDLNLRRVESIIEVGYTDNFGLMIVIDPKNLLVYSKTWMDIKGMIPMRRVLKKIIELGYHL